MMAKMAIKWHGLAWHGLKYWQTWLSMASIAVDNENKFIVIKQALRHDLMPPF